MNDTPTLHRSFLEYAATHGRGGTLYGILRDLFRKAWSAESADPAGHGQLPWSPGHPETGQSIVTALVIQDLFGGEIVRNCLGDDPLDLRGGTLHYYNHVTSRHGHAIMDIAHAGLAPTQSLMDAERVEREYLLDSTEAVTAQVRQRYCILLVDLASFMLGAR